MANILKFERPKTKEHHDTMRQVSRSEMPSIQLWFHKCSVFASDFLLEKDDNGLALTKGTDCPFCHKTEQDFKEPESLTDALLHIARAQQPKVNKWEHLCPCAGMVNTVLPDGHICPDCFVDQYGVHHNRPDGVA